MPLLNNTKSVILCFACVDRGNVYIHILFLYHYVIDLCKETYTTSLDLSL